MASLNTAIEDLYTRLGYPTLSRCMTGIGEEAGEVLGAYNKWKDRRQDKPKTTEDIITEMTQLIATTLLAGHVIGIESTDLIYRSMIFAVNKESEVKTRKVNNNG